MACRIFFRERENILKTENVTDSVTGCVYNEVDKTVREGFREESAI